MTGNATSRAGDGAARPGSARVPGGATTRRWELWLLFVAALAAAAALFVAREVRQRRAAHAPHRAPAVSAPVPSGQGIVSPTPGALPSMEAAVELQSVADRIRAAWRRAGAPPATTRGLPADEESPGGAATPAGRDPPVDLWGHPYVLERSAADGAARLTLVSLGSDGRPGGEGTAGDLHMEITDPREGASGETRGE